MMAEKDIILENRNDAGEIKIANEVIISIAEQALNEIQGIALGSVVDSFVEKLVKKSTSGGVKVYLDEEKKTVDMDVHVSMQYGMNILEVSWKIQDAVKKNVEAMTDIDVCKVNVFVDGVILEKEPKPEKIRKTKVSKKADEPAEDKASAEE